MSDDPLIRRLSQFTPDGSGLDRDALLFAAGRASARPNRRWQGLAAALGVSQLLTLGLLLWPRASSPMVGPIPVETPVAVVEPPPAPAPTLLLLRAQFLAAEGNPPLPPPTENLMPSEPPLRTFDALSPLHSPSSGKKL